MTASAITEREIVIPWFAGLTRLLGKYLAVLRYELEHCGDTQTIEALIHAEITKILVRELTQGCVTTEYPIGKYFAKGTIDGGKRYDRRFRADIAVFHPVHDPQSQASQPIVVIELKRTGSPVELLDDIYRLAVISLKTRATGYFVLAGPRKRVQSAISSVPLLKSMHDGAEVGEERDVLHTFNFSQLAGSSLYNVEDYANAEHFYGQRMFGEENKSETDPYQVQIFAFQADRQMITAKEGQRIFLKLRSVDSSSREQAALPTING